MPVHTDSIALVPTGCIVSESAKAGSVAIARTGTKSIDDMVLSAFPDAPKMLQVAYCESGNGCAAPIDPQAKNPGSSATGVFQIVKGTWKAYKCSGDPYRASDNIACARKIYDAEGYKPWRSSGQW